MHISRPISRTIAPQNDPIGLHEKYLDGVKLSTASADAGSLPNASSKLKDNGKPCKNKKSWWAKKKKASSDNWDIALSGAFQSLHHKKWAEEASVDERDRYGCTPLHIYAECNSHKDVDILLKKHRVDCNAVSAHGMRAIHLACRHGNTAPLLALIHAHADLNVTDISGWTPLHYACAYGHIECVSALLKAKAQPNIGDFMENTPLHYAVEFDRGDVVRMLLRYNADPHAHNRFLESAYSIAIEEGIDAALLEMRARMAKHETKEDHHALKNERLIKNNI